ncbi:MAG: S9 family peptidase [Ktedonobacteraceae bacterium]|nr:S9 family peptidase [Ktedonobacteraceae bacterium]
MTRETRKLTHDDLWTFKDLGHIAISPDGKRVAFTVLRKDKEKDEVLSDIMLLQIDEQGQALGEPRQLTRGGKNNSFPAWAPDSQRLLFISDRQDEKRQIWLLDVNGGEACQLTDLQRGVNEIAWSPDGKWIAFTSVALPTDDDDVLTGRKKLDEAAKKQQEKDERFGLRTITSIWYRLDGRGMLDKRSHLFVMPAPRGDDIHPDPASIRRLTSGNYDHSTIKWSPDSREVGLICNRNENRDRTWVNDLWTVEVETGEARRISNSTLQIATYTWSPNGEHIALLASQDMSIEGSSLDRLWLVARRGGEMRILPEGLDYDVAPTMGIQFGRLPYAPQWSADGKRIYVSVAEHGRANLHVVDVEQGTHTQLTEGERIIEYLALLPGERHLLFAQSEPLHPWEFHVLSLENGTPGEERRLTHLYDRQLAEYSWSEPERIVYKGSNGDQIDSWLIRPIGAKEGLRYPLFVHIHGGPQSAFGVGLNPFLQYCAAQGFAIFYCNPHGSTTCGEAFMRQVEGDWGGWDYQDIMLGVDECIARGVADPERLVVSGYSYGGYMTMFILGQTNRFRAAVPMAGVSNLASFVGTSDIGFWQTFQAKGYPWDKERASYYSERSPLTHADKVTTPTLVYHPESDLRCPIEQSEQFYMALKMMGKVPVEFVRVPAHWHIGAEKPGLMLQRWEKMLDWFRKYVEIRPAEYK